MNRRTSGPQYKQQSKLDHGPDLANLLPRDCVWSFPQGSCQWILMCLHLSRAYATLCQAYHFCFPGPLLHVFCRVRRFKLGSEPTARFPFCMRRILSPPHLPFQNYVEGPFTDHPPKEQPPASDLVALTTKSYPRQLTRQREEAKTSMDPSTQRADARGWRCPTLRRSGPRAESAPRKHGLLE